MSEPDLILEARGIVRRYPGTVALKGIDFQLHRNQVNVLIGENGAGKSTLMRILAGVEQPDEGEIVLEGHAVQLGSPRAAAQHGIAIVHQELAALPNLDVTENIFAGRELCKGSGLLDRSAEEQHSARALERLRHLLPVDRPVSQLSLGDRQMLELARAIAHGAKILILDEPTSALSQTETETLFQVIAELKAAGVTIVYISHRLHELLHLGDHFTVFRSGTVTGVATRADVTRDWIVERMSGHAYFTENVTTAIQQDRVALAVDGLVLAGSAADTQLPITFQLHRGEILGIYGLLGAGRTELVEALAGSRAIASGDVRVNGKPADLADVTCAMRSGIVLVPEDRQRDGLIPELSIRDNVMLAAAHGAVLSKAAETVRVQALLGKLHIKVPDLDLPVSALSGGNQQKILLARCLLHQPIVLMLDEPTRGVDVTAKAEIYRLLRELAADGLSVLFTSSEIEETRLLADRVLVLCQGRIAAELRRNEVTDEALFAAASPDILADTPYQHLEHAS